jgi:predicted transposase YbfD/YdcC
MSDKSQTSKPDYEELSNQAATSLLSYLAVIEDPRGRQGSLHKFIDILAILVLGTVCGCDDAEKLEVWAQKEEEWLKTFLELRNGTPCQDTYLRALAAMDPQVFRTVFQKWSGDLFTMLGINGQVAVDGKTVRGARLPGQSKSPVHIVSALACEQGLVLGQLRTEEKSNEITAMPQLLNALHLEGALVSADAMGCQIDIAQTIIDKNGDYLFGLKGNQPTVNEEAILLFKEAADSRMRAIDELQRPVTERDEQVDGGHGRIESRTATVCHDFEEWAPSAMRFPKCTTLIQIQSSAEEATTGVTRNDMRYYISSRRLTAAEANFATREHWRIENTLHWCLDMTFKEDACRIRTGNAAENLNLIRHFAFSILKAYKKDKLTVSKRRLHCDYKLDYRMKVLANAVS